jgi:hypothetical protein
MPASTDFINRAKVPKLVGYLLLEDAIRLWSMTISVTNVRLS